MDGAQVVWMLMALVAVAGALGVVLFDSPVRAALSLVVNFFVLAFLYFSLSASLLGITQIIVYAGAIMVLFLFVIMLLKADRTERELGIGDNKPAIAAAITTAIAVLVAAQVAIPLNKVAVTSVPDGYGAPAAIGRALFTTYAWPFLVTSLLLLVGIVGSIMLAKRGLPD